MKNTVTFKQDIKAGNYQTNDITALLTSNVAGDGSQQFIFDFQTLQPISNVTIIPSFTSSANGLSVAFVDMSSPQDAIISEAWDFGDSTSISNTIGNQNHTYSSNGTYNVSLSAVNDSGSIFNFSNTITVSSVNQPPVAYFSFAINGLTVTIHDSSSDPENAALSEVLNWGDGSPSIEQVEGQTHTYVAGTYTITLTVTDPEGASSTYTKSVTLIDPNPQPAPGIPYNNNPTHLIEVNVTDGTGRIYSANATVGNDPTKPFQYKPLTDSNGVAHRGLTAHFYEDCVEVSVTRADAAYDEMNCHLTVTYDGVSAAVPPSSFVDGHVDFWRGCRMPAIRYGKQMAYDPNLIDWSVLPNYDRTPQTPYNESKSTYTFNGLGTTNQPAMGTTGERGEIGFLQQSNMAFLLEPNDQNWGVLRRCDDWAGQWSSVYYCDPVTGDILDVNTYPDACTLPLNQRAPHSNNPIAIYGGSYNGDVLTPPIDGWRMSASPLAPNGGHLTSYCMLTPMVCPTARDKDHCAFWANWTRLEINPSYTLQRGCMVGSQRRAAWCLRSLFLASYYSSHTQYFADEVARNLTIANAVVQNPFGLLATDIAYGGEGPRVFRDRLIVKLRQDRRKCERGRTAPFFIAPDVNALWSALEATGHEGLALVTLQALGAGFLVASRHLLLLSGRRGGSGLVGGSGWRGGLVLAGQTVGHEGLALVAFQALDPGLLVASGHLVLLRSARCRRGGRFTRGSRRGGWRGGAVLARQATGHEGLAGVARPVLGFGVGVALGHAFLLRLG